MLELIFLLLKSLGFVRFLPAGIPMVLNLLPSKVLLSKWDRTASTLFVANLVISSVFFAVIFFYYWRYYRVTANESMHRPWWLGLFLVFVVVYVASVLVASGNLFTHSGAPVNVLEIIFPLGFYLALDNVLFYLFLSLFYWKWPSVVRKGLPPVAWFTR